MPELSDAARRLLDAQKQRYVQGLPEKSRQIKQLGNDSYELREAAHKIAGSAGLHGLDKVQRCAVSLEEAIKGGNESHEAELQALLDALESAAAGSD